MPELVDVLPKLAFSGLTFLKEIAPGVYGYASRHAMHRVRAYHSAVLSPIGGRGPLQEMLLVGHVHVQEGKVTRVEGFNGGEGERWAVRARDELTKSGHLAPDTVVSPATALRACQHANATYGR